MTRLLLVITFFVLFSTTCFSEEKNYLILNSDTLRILNEMKPELETDIIGGYIEENSTIYWRIINDSLFTVKSIFENQPENLNSIDYKRFYGEFSSTIYCPNGKLMFKSKELQIYEKEKGFKFENGILKSVKTVINPKPIISDYAVSTDTLYEYFKKEIDFSKIPDQIYSRPILLRITNISSEGKIKELEVLNYNEKPLNDELIRAIKAIPKWNVIYEHGLKTGYYSIIKLDMEKIKTTR